MRLFWLWIWIISCAQLHYLDSCVWSLHAKQSNQPNQSISLTSVVNTVYFMGKLHQPLHQTADEFQLNQFMESTSEMPAAECVYCTMFLPDVVIPESPEAFVKLTEQTLRSSTGRQQQTPACHKCSGGQINSCTLSDITLVAYSPALTLICVDFLTLGAHCDRRRHFLTPGGIGSIPFWFLQHLVLRRCLFHQNRNGIQPNPSFF